MKLASYTLFSMNVSSSGTSIRQSLPGPIIPLFENGNEFHGPPIWFAMSFESDSLLMFPTASCPVMVDCETAQRARNNLVLGDGTPLGVYYWNDGSWLDPERHVNVAGLIGLGPKSPIALSRVLCIHTDRRVNQALKLSMMEEADPRWTGHHYSLGETNGGWKIPATLTYEKSKGKKKSVGASSGNVGMNFFSLDVSIPDIHAPIFNLGWKMIGPSMEVHEGRLYYSCWRFKSTNDWTAFKLILGDHIEVRIVWHKLFEPNKVGDLCATNLVFNRGDFARVGKTAFMRHDIALDGKNRRIYFISHDSLTRPMSGPIIDVPVPPTSFRYAWGSKTETANGVSWTWTSKESHHSDFYAYKEEFRFITNPLHLTNGENDSFVIRCLAQPCRTMLDPLLEVMQKMTGKLEVHRQSDGSLLAKENRELGRFQTRIVQLGDDPRKVSIKSVPL